MLYDSSDGLSVKSSFQRRAFLFAKTFNPPHLLVGISYNGRRICDRPVRDRAEGSRRGRDVVYPTVRRCREVKRATEQELEGTAAHSAKEESRQGGATRASEASDFAERFWTCEVEKPRFLIQFYQKERGFSIWVRAFGESPNRMSSVM